MLGTHAPGFNQVKTFKFQKSHAWVAAVIFVVLVGIGGWVSYQNGLWSQWLPQSTPVTAASGDIVLVPAQSATLAAGGEGEQMVMASSDTGAEAVAAAAASDLANEAATAATTAAAPATTTFEPVVISGVAGVDGAGLWDDAGNLLATLDSAAALKITAVSANGAWLSVQTAAGNGWTPTADVIAYGLGNLETALLPGVLAAAGGQAATALSAGAAAVLAADGSVAASSLEVAQPAAAPSASLVATVASDGSNLNIRSEPGTDGAVLAKAADGAVYTAIGRNEAGDWLLLQLSAADGDTAATVGWASAAYVELSGDVQTLPLVDAANSAV